MPTLRGAALQAIDALEEILNGFDPKHYVGVNGNRRLGVLRVGEMRRWHKALEDLRSAVKEGA